MQKPNLDSVKKHFENDGWNVRLEYSSDYVKLYANKTITTGPASTFNTNEFLEAYFAYRAEDMDLREKHENKAADKRNLEDLKKYQEVWGEKVIYLGSPKAVAFYEKEFGVSSAASGQVFPSTKLVSAVEAAFKKAGYSVDLSG
ncbi:MAG: hypothetical protein FWH35_03235, partial [Treponema sp.]|nr:hypothetical protein [Treponema sp.]